MGLALLWGTYFWLKSFTHHNEALSVPNLKGMKAAEARSALQERNLEMVLSDSAYVPGRPPMTVVEQQPEASDKVKINRKIYLKVNATKPPKVPLPDLTDVSHRQALKILNTKGFEVGSLEYVPGMAKNTVVRLKHADTTVSAGAKLAKGSTIDLVLEQGRSAAKTQLPSLTGLSQSEAKFYLKGKGLNFGSVIYDSTVVDSQSAIIYKQRPLYRPKQKIAKGEVIDVWLTSKTTYQDASAIPNNETLSPADTSNY